jgi:uncharacterized protein YndB with AHSA1/START domain
MIALTDSIEIRVKPQVIFEWLENLEKHYKEWHPDHVRWTNETGQFKEGSRCYVEEYVHGRFHRIRARYTRIERNRRIEYRMLYPTSVICSKGSFLLQSNRGNTIFTATLAFRGGRILSRLFHSRMEGIKKHMREEGENLKTILERQYGERVS